MLDGPGGSSEGDGIILVWVVEPERKSGSTLVAVSRRERLEVNKKDLSAKNCMRMTY